MTAPGSSGSLGESRAAWMGSGGTPRMSGAVRLHCVAKGCIRGLQLGPAQVVLGTVKGCLFEKLKACFVTAMLVHQ